MSIDSWSERIDGCISALTERAAIAIGEPADDALYRQVAVAGLPGVMPLWTARRQTVGLLVMPTQEPQDWPAVLIDDSSALTLASDAQTLVPQYIVKRLLSKFPENADKLAQQWTRIAPQLMALHLVLGGRPESLDAVAEAFLDGQARESFRVIPGQVLAFEQAHSGLGRRIDLSETFQCFANWMDKAVDGQAEPVEPFDRYGAWARRVAMSAGRVSMARPEWPVPGIDSLQRLIEEFAGVDSAISAKPTWSSQAGAASGEAALSETALLIDAKAQPSTDTIAAAIVRALVAEGTSYTGVAHAEATVLLDEAGESTRAWAVLQSACWWSARSMGETIEPMRAGCMLLAERHDWTDVQWVLRRAAEAG